MNIIGYKRIQSLGPLNSKILRISDEQFDKIADYFPTYKSINQSAAEESLFIFNNAHRPHGQGLVDKETREAIESYSMERAIQYCQTNGYSIEDHSQFRPYDLFLRKDRKEYYVEVKGTQSLGNEIFLTNNEVRWANKYYKQTILFTVHSIEIKRTSTGVKGENGHIKIIEPWKPERDNLYALSYRYTLNL